MKKAKRKKPLIAEEELEINQFLGLNTFGPHADDPPNTFRVLENYDIYGGYVKERRGSTFLNESVVPNYDILNHAVFDAGTTGEYVVIQQKNVTTSEFRFMRLHGAGVWADVVLKDTSTLFTLATTDKADMFVSNGKLYVYSTAGNAILEWDDVNFKFVKRKLGLPAPQIRAVDTHGGGSLNGKRVYAVELVYKDTTVTPAVDIIVSGPNRALEVITGPSFHEGRLAYSAEDSDKKYRVRVSRTMNDGSDIEDTENNNWTHVRLWRSKDMTTASTLAPDLEGDSEILGRPDELYQVQEMDRTTFLGTWDGSLFSFDDDDILDDDIPFPLDVVTSDRLELVPMPPAELGVFHNNRVWVSGVTALPGPGGDISAKAIQSKIYYSPETDTKYSESMRTLNAIESDPGDGQLMKKLVPFQEDLIGIKEGKTGRVRNGNPLAGWVTFDENIGIADKELAQFVPSVGICARVNDQKDFRILDYQLRWTNIFAGTQISRPIRSLISVFATQDADFIYMNGKLMISGGDSRKILVLSSEQQGGWSTYNYPFNDLAESMFTFEQGTRALILNRNQIPLEIEVQDFDGNYEETDYDPIAADGVDIDLAVTTYKFQDNHGRSLIEERFISVVAAASKVIYAQAYVNGKEWAAAFPLLLDPLAYSDANLRETEYQGYQEYRAIGNYIHYSITTVAPCTIYSIMLNCLIQRDSIRPGFDPFEILEDAETEPAWGDVSSDIIETGTAVNTYTETGTADNDILEGE